jgi:xylulokinase
LEGERSLLLQPPLLHVRCKTADTITKTIALDWESGEILASAQKSYGFVPDLPPGAMEQNPNDWIDAAGQSIDEVVARLGARKTEIRGIGVSGQQHGLVVLDQDDQVIRPAKLWNDTSTGAQCDQITNHFGGPENVIALVGNTIRTGYTATKIPLAASERPEGGKRRGASCFLTTISISGSPASGMEFDASGTPS